MDTPRHVRAAIAIVAILTIASIILSIENITSRNQYRAGEAQDARERTLARTFAKQRGAAAALNDTLIKTGVYDGDLPIHRGRNTTIAPPLGLEEQLNPDTATPQNIRDRARRAPLPVDHVEEPQVESRAIFERVGRIALSTSFGHLKIDLHFGEILQRWHELFKLTQDAEQQLQKQGGFGLHHSYLVQQARIVAEQKMSHLLFVIGLVAPESIQTMDQLIASLEETFPTEATHPQPTTTTTTNHTRVRRQLFAAGAVVTSLVSFGLSVYSISQIARLDTLISSVHAQVNIVASRVTKNSLKINQIISYLKDNKEVIGRLYENIHLLKEESVMRAYLDQVNMMLNRFNAELDDYLAGILELTRQKLSPLLLSVEDVGPVWDQLVARAARKGLTPISASRNLLFSSKVSVVAITPPDAEKPWPDIVVFVHVPLVRGELQDLFRYVASPNIVGNVMVSYVAPPFLALSPNQALATSLSSHDLLRCDVYDAKYHCIHQNSISRDPATMCLYAIYFNRKPETVCSTEVSHQRSFAHEIAHGSFAIGSITDYELSVSCANGTTHSKQKRGTTIIHLPAGCTTITTPHNILYSNNEFDMEAELAERPLTIPKEILQSGVPDSIVMEDAIVDHFLAADNIAPIDLAAFKRAMAIQELRYRAARAGNAFTIIGYVVAAIIALALLGWGARRLLAWYRHRGTRHRNDGTRDTMRMTPPHGNMHITVTTTEAPNTTSRAIDNVHPTAPPPARATTADLHQARESINRNRASSPTTTGATARSDTTANTKNRP